MSFAELSGGPPPKPADAPPTPPLAGPSRIEYMRAYQFIFENPNWKTNLLWLALAGVVAGLVPGVGMLVYIPLLGYMFEVIESLLASGGRSYPDVDMNRIERYFYRGLWPFLVGMIVSMVATFVVMPLWYGALLATIFSGAGVGGDTGKVLIVLAMPVLFLLLMVALAAIGVVTLPFTLRAGFRQDFAEGFDFGWARDFWKRVGMDVVLANLFFFVTYSVLALLGTLAFCVGLYAAVAVATLAWSHLAYQLYSVYLSRGGTPVPPKPETPPAGAPPAAQY